MNDTIYSLDITETFIQMLIYYRKEFMIIKSKRVHRYSHLNFYGDNRLSENELLMQTYLSYYLKPHTTNVTNETGSSQEF